MTTAPAPAAAPQARPVTYYWLATIQRDNGQQITCDGTLPATLGKDTRMDLSRTVMQQIRDLYGNFTILFLDLAPNQITPAP